MAQQMLPDSALLGVEAVAELLGVSTRTVWDLRAQGRFAPATKVGRRVFWRREKITAWLELQTEDSKQDSKQ